MIRQISTLVLKFRVLVVGAAAVVVALGVTQLSAAPVTALPEFGPVHVQIQVEALGLSAAEVEQLITIPLEHLLNGVAWVDQIQSESMPGLSSIDLIFRSGTPLLKARQVVMERMGRADTLPNVGTPPVIIQPLSAMSRVMMVGLSSQDLSLVDLSILARWKIKPRLMGIPGVAGVTIWGARDRQLQVQIDPEQLRKNGVTLSQVISTTGNALWVSPLTFIKASTPGTGGFIDTANQRFTIQHVLPITTAGDLSSVIVEDTVGRTLRLGQVATVVEGHQPLIGDAVLSSGPGLMLVIQKFPDASTGDVTKGVQEALDAMRPGLPGVAMDTSVYQAQTYVQKALLDLAKLALAGLVLLGALLLLLLPWRLAVISFATIVMTVVTAAFVVYLTGTTFNMMVLAGLAVALGVVVGDALVDVASIERRLRQHRLVGGPPQSTLAVVTNASSSVRRPLVFATLIVLIAPLPLLFLDGVAGSFSRPAILAYVLAVLCSMVIAMTVTPGLALLLLPSAPLGHRSGPLVRWAGRLFDATVPRYMRQPRWAYATMAVLLLAAIAVVPQLNGRSLLPSPQDRTLLVNVQTAPGTSLPEMQRVTAAAVQQIRSVPGIQGVGGHLGRAVTGDQVVDVNSGQLWITVADSADYDATVAAVRRVLRSYPGVSSELMTYSQDRINAVQAGTSSALVVRVFGQDLDVIRSKAEELRQLISTVPGVVQPTVQSQIAQPTLEVQVDLGAAQRYGLNPGDVRRAATTFYQGLLVGNLYDQQQVIDVVVVGSPAAKSSTSIADLLVDLPAGGHVRLGDVASVKVTAFPTLITHNASSRSLDVTAGVSGRDLTAVLSDVNNRVQSVQMPMEYHAEVLSGLQTKQGQDLQAAGLALAALIAIFLVLQAAFGSWRLAALIFVTLPLAAAGGVVAAWLVGGIMTLGALMGLFAVEAVAARSIVLLVRRYRRLESLEGVSQRHELILRATRESAGPVLMTAAATTAVLIPLTVFGSAAGTEVLYPLAAVVIGGLVSATVVTLLLIPAVYLRFAPADRSEQPGFEPAKTLAALTPKGAPAQGAGGMS
ncbi:MAG: efflux RND transporter permease subunit [Candidatus Dormibacteraeota bacterium]|nr:efflux RND transporter permease subunit [Candidatus Dormibacteraeota bacterium]MDQ6900437.1 efflux RND transporter permease subunit [Candidatus Dormibacteraeota bacterium]